MVDSRYIFEDQHTHARIVWQMEGTCVCVCVCVCVCGCLLVSVCFAILSAGRKKIVQKGTLHTRIYLLLVVHVNDMNDTPIGIVPSAPC